MFSKKYQLIVLIVLVFAVFGCTNKNEKKQLDICRDKYPEIILSSVDVYTTATEVSFPEMSDFFGFRAQFKEPITCNGKKYKSALLDYSSRGARQFLMMAYHKDSYILRDVTLQINSDELYFSDARHIKKK
jgi:hypothetical protein